MKKIKFKELKEKINYFQGKSVLLIITGLVKTKIKIKQVYLQMKKNNFIIKVDEKINIAIDINWVANFYTNDTNTILKLEFDNLGEVVLVMK